jgi:flagellar hook-length control protein FliK
MSGATPTADPPAAAFAGSGPPAVAPGQRPPGAGEAGPAAGTGPPGSDSGPPAFASVLKDQVARTALAEGQKGTGKPPVSGRDGKDPDAGGDATQIAAASMLQAIANATGGSTATTAQAAAADQAPAASAGSSTAAAAGTATPAAGLQLPGPAGAADAAAGVPDGAGATGAPSTAGSPQAPPALTGPDTNAPKPAAPGGPLPASTSVAGNPTPAATADTTAAASTGTGTSASPGPVAQHDGQPAPVAGSVTPAPAQPSQSSPDGQATAAPASLTPPAGTGSAGSGGSDASGTPGDRQPASTAHAASAEAQPASAGAPAAAATATTSTPFAAQLTDRSLSPVGGTTPATVQPTAPHPGVALSHAIETVRMTIDLAARQGYSQARIQLSPPELGDIRIHLHQTADGLVARVVAEHATAAQTLQQGGADLRRQLESSGLALLRLDIEASGQRGAGAQDPGSAGGGAPLERSPADEEAAGSEDTTAGTTSVTLPSGAVVDVLA